MRHFIRIEKSASFDGGEGVSLGADTDNGHCSQAGHTRAAGLGFAGLGLSRRGKLR
jgi:hypothetical protein